jgi:hypothetical protein
LFAVLALFFNQFHAIININQFRKFYRLLVLATFLTMALPVSWYLSNSIFYWINSLGVLLQLWSFLIFIKMIRPHFQSFFNKLQAAEKLFYGLALTSLGLKIIIQLVVLVPELAQVSHQIRNFVIGYIHLTMLGIITGFLLAFTLQNELINKKKSFVNWGIKLFLVGFTSSELLLFIQGSYLFLNLGQFKMYYQNLFLSSLFLPLGIVLLTAGLFREKDNFLK